MVNKKITKKQSPRRYDLGDFVTKNQQGINNGLMGVASLGAMTGNDTITGATSGLASGAALGTTIMPGIGTAVGAVGGALLGGIIGGKKARAKKNAIRTQDQLRQAGVMDQFESDINTVNENPYGVYKKGGDVKQDNTRNSNLNLRVKNEGHLFNLDNNPEYKRNFEAQIKAKKDLELKNKQKLIQDRKDRINTANQIQSKGLSRKRGATALKDKAQIFPNDPNNFVDEYLNPFAMIGGMADNLQNALSPDASLGERALAVGTPLAVGALSGIGAKSIPKFANNLLNPLAGVNPKNVSKFFSKNNKNELTPLLNLEDVSAGNKQWDDWINSSEYVKRRSATTGESADEIAKQVKKYNNRKWGYQNNVNLDDAAGNYNASPIPLLQKDIIQIGKGLSKEEAAQVFNHEMGHLKSPAGKSGANKLYKDYPTINFDVNDFKGDKNLTNYYNLPEEQQVRFMRANFKIRDQLGIPSNDYNPLTNDQMNKWFDNHNIKSFRDQPGYSDVTELLETGVSSGKLNRSNMADYLNKAWIGAGAIGAGATLNNKYEDGGDVNPNIINIEKDEIQIDPNNGKILRKYTGINPETGGKYEAHSKKGQDTINNMVTAKEGTFIITKKDAKKYEDAVKNNDKLAQNTIMSNIRNKKQQMIKYADGGDIYDYNKFNPQLSPMAPLNNLVPTINTINSRPYTPLTLNKLNINPKSSISTPVSNNNSINKGIENALDYLPIAANAFQGLQTPNYLQYRNVRPDVRNRQQVLNNMPNQISVNPVLNSIYGNANSNSRSIYQNTSNPAIARALNQANNDATNRAINDAYYQNNNMNNSIKAQRASIYSNLAQSQENINAQNAQMMLNVDNTNRDMDLAKRQQLNYALSQLSQLNQTNKTNKQKGNREQQTLDLLKEIFPNAGYIFDQYKGGKNGK